MHPTRNVYFRVGNDFLHDTAAGFFPGAVALAWMVRRALSFAGLEAAFPTAQAVSALWTVLLVCLVVSVGTGLFRLRYRLVHVRSEFHRDRTETAFLKHTMFVLLLLGSSVALSSFVPG